MEDDDELLESDLFDVTDVEYSFQQTRDRRKLYFIMKSDRPFNLMKSYLAIKQYLFQLECEIGIMEEPPETM